MAVRLQTALLLIVVATAVELVRGQVPGAAGTAVVAGEVIDATTGSPISGAIVTLGRGPAKAAEPPPPAVPRVLTTATGRFALRDVGTGSFSLVATKPGYLLAEFGRSRPDGPSRPLVVAPDDRVIDVVVRMWRAATISGTVVDEAGEPIGSASVRVYRRTRRSGRLQLVDARGATTDDRGVYRVADLIPGDYSAVARQVPSSASLQPARGSAATPQPIPPPSDPGRVWVYPTTFYPAVSTIGQATVLTLGSGEERPAVDFNLHPVAVFRVSGMVMSAAGPMRGLVPVTLTPAGEDAGGASAETPTAMTDRAGRFDFAMVPSGQYTLAVTDYTQALRPPHDVESGVWARVPLVVGQSDISGLAVPLEPGLSISGAIQFEGAGLRPSAADVGVTVQSVGDSKERIGGFINTAAAGEFTLRGYPPGSYLLDATVRVQGWVLKSALYNGRDISCSPLDLRSSVSGVVLAFVDRVIGAVGTVRTPRGDRDGNAFVVVFPGDAQNWTPHDSNSRCLRSTRSARDGSYSFDRLPPGEYYVAALTDDEAADWPDPALLESIAKSAAQVTIGEQTVTQDLRSRRTP
jgi:hypothetical protein